MLVYSNSISPRLQYITDFIGKEISGEAFQLTSDINKFKNHQGPKINYSRESITAEELRIENADLLFENDIRKQNIECFQFNEHKAFFKTEGDFPFDIFTASFYLLSRYEEYLPHEKDRYGRFAHKNSLAYKENFLDQPLINHWLKDFKKLLQEKFSSLRINNPAFTFLPTYDIDMAWSYLHKSWWRNVGGSINSIINACPDTVGGQWASFRNRIKVLSGKEKDPFDSFAWMDQLHTQFKLKPYYFFLVAARNNRYDKNISPDKKPMQALIQHHYYRYPVGIHPSWQSGDNPDLLKNEIQLLEKITGGKIRSSRQHFIRFTLPQTYRCLIDAGIEFDFSMGYGSINGFRASVASPFYWYDLEKEAPTKLTLFPFCYMDANSFFEQKYSAPQALEEINKYYEAVKSVNGTFVIIWHNTFLGTDPFFKGWREVYEKFIQEIGKE